MRINKNESEKLKKIAMLGHKRIPSREGGVEVAVETIAAEMVKKGYEVTCYNRRGEHIAGKEFDGGIKQGVYRGIRLKQVFTVNIKGVSAFLASISATFRAVLDKPDVIHYHAEGSCGMIWLPHLLGIRTVATIHGLDWKRDKWKGGFGEKYIFFGEKMAVRYADEIIVLSEGVRKYFLDTYNRETVFIPNGADRAEIRDPDIIKKNWNLDKDGYILFLGRIVPEKGVDYLIKAYKKLDTDKKLVIAGSASDTDEYYEYIRTLADDCEDIIFTGFVQGQVYEELFSNAYIYVLPSNLEGMPLSLLEAMSYGNCCLVSDISECTDVVGNAAEAFECGNVDSLAEKLKKLLEHPEITNEYKKNSRDYICSKYSWDDITDRTLKLYEKVFNMKQG